MTSFFNILADTATAPAAPVENNGVLLLFIAVPILGALLLALWPKIGDGTARVIGLAFSFFTLLLCAILGGGESPFRHPSLGSGPLGIGFDLALSGSSFLLILLTGIITPMSLAASWKVERPRLFNILFLLMQSAVLGVFLAQNFFFWFLFWELSLFPAFFLIKLWGGAGAGRAAYQFVIYTIGGSAFMLLAFAAIYAVTGSFDFTLGLAGPDGYAPEAALLAQKFGPLAPQLAFFGVLIGLAVKVPLFPFHTWLPATYATAPTGVSMFLTAVMAKMGLYGFMILMPRFFQRELAAAAPWLIWLALAGVVFGAYAAMRQKDLKRMVAYSSVNHLSYCLLALFAMPFLLQGGAPNGVRFAYSGFWLQAFNHGLSAAALFFCVGVLESRAGVRGLHDFGGVRKVAPVFAALCGFSLFSSLGLPGLNGFVGEFLIFRGVFALVPWAAAVATLGLLGTAIFLLTFWQKVFHGPSGEHTGAVVDLSKREIAILAPVVALMVLFGVWPQWLLDILNSAL